MIRGNWLLVMLLAERGKNGRFGTSGGVRPSPSWVVNRRFTRYEDARGRDQQLREVLAEQSHRGRAVKLATHDGSFWSRSRPRAGGVEGDLVAPAARADRGRSHTFDGVNWGVTDWRGSVRVSGSKYPRHTLPQRAEDPRKSDERGFQAPTFRSGARSVGEVSLVYTTAPQISER